MTRASGAWSAPEAAKAGPEIDATCVLAILQQVPRFPCPKSRVNRSRMHRPAVVEIGCQPRPAPKRPARSLRPAFTATPIRAPDNDALAADAVRKVALEAARAIPYVATVCAPVAGDTHTMTPPIPMSQQLSVGSLDGSLRSGRTLLGTAATRPLHLDNWANNPQPRCSPNLNAGWSMHHADGLVILGVLSIQVLG